MASCWRSSSLAAAFIEDSFCEFDCSSEDIRHLSRLNAEGFQPLLHGVLLLSLVGECCAGVLPVTPVSLDVVASKGAQPAKGEYEGAEWPQ